MHYPSAPGEVVQRSYGWLVLAFLPLAGWALLVCTFVLRPEALSWLAEARGGSFATWAATYWFAMLAHAAIFIVHAARNPRLRPSGSLPWILGFAFVAPLAAPFYWWRGLTRRE